MNEIIDLIINFCATLNPATEIMCFLGNFFLYNHYFIII